jgi:hypothetical protein
MNHSDCELQKQEEEGKYFAQLRVPMKIVFLSKHFSFVYAVGTGC